MAVKHVDPYEKTLLDKMMFIIYFLMIFFGFPTLAFYAICNFISQYYGYSKYGYSLGTLLSIVFIAIILTYRYTVKSYKTRTNILIDSFRSDLAFEPTPECEFYTQREYIGIDTKRGTIVYIGHPHDLSKDVFLMAFDNNNWRRAELINSTIPAVRIYTNYPNIPYITFTGKKAPRIFDIISAMRGKNYQYDVSNPGYVEYKAEQAANEHGFNLILPRA
ncbi:hypothetical protein FPT51_19170 [Salmonella enterica]|nr:hypothetical protein [Salmonella enterica]EKQ5162983.1 plasmid IncI1-type surface exclusion protein ExcA [Salmonella enterica]